MAEPLVTSPVFRDCPNAWVSRMCDRLLAPNVGLTERDKRRVAKYRARFAIGSEYTAGPNAYDHLCRIARACGLFAKRRKIKSPPQAPKPPPPIPAQHELYAPMPKPPPLRRPVVMTETWDPAGMPGL